MLCVGMLFLALRTQHMSDYFEQVTRLARARKSNNPLFIAVDGHSAAGKSTLANKLLATFDKAVLICTDDFYRVMDEETRFKLTPEDGYALYYDWQRLKQEVLIPLSTRKAAEYCVYDWDNNQLGELKQVESAEYIIVEGCYAARPELSHFFDIIILVETSAIERQQRQAERNDASSDWLKRWDAAENFYLSDLRSQLTTPEKFNFLEKLNFLRKCVSPDLITTNLANRANIVVRNLNET